MNVAEVPSSRQVDRPQLPGGRALWIRQVLALIRLELRKNLFGRYSLAVYFLALLPVGVLVFMLMVASMFEEDALFESVTQARLAYAMFFQTFVLRAIIFFGCIGIFTNLFRGEVLDRSLHFYMLSPVRRQVLTCGKFLAGLMLVTGLFVVSVSVSYVLVHVPFGTTMALEHLFSTTGITQLTSYIMVTALACLGYGSVFLIVGILFRNPIVPAAVVLGWEIINFLLPPMLKKLSVIHYLKGLFPVTISEGPFAVVADPPPMAASIGGLLLFSAFALFIANLVVRRMEIRYSDD